MVPALKTPRPKHALGGVLSMMRGEILRQAPSCGPSLYDPLTGDSREDDIVPGKVRTNDRDLRQPENGCRVSPCYR